MKENTVKSRLQHRRPAIRLLLAIAAAATMIGAVSVASASPASADGCYTWSGTLRSGSTGEAVRQLQIRVAGWMTQDTVLDVDGEYGPATAAAVKRFQAGYGLDADGIAGPQTFNKIYELQDDDCTPIHFTLAELNHCNSDFSGSAVATAAQAKLNAIRVMWQLEALRKKLGDRPLTISSGFRSDRCNAAVEGAPESMHRWALGADITGSSAAERCRIWHEARKAGFSGLLGQGYTGHNDHVHADSRHALNRSAFRSAPSC